MKAESNQERDKFRASSNAKRDTNNDGMDSLMTTKNNTRNIKSKRRRENVKRRGVKDV
jgi:hypothetical protein